MKKTPINKKWWFWVLAIIFFPITCLVGVYLVIVNYRKTNNKLWLIAIIPLVLLSIIGFSGYASTINGKNNSSAKSSQVSSSISSSKIKHSSSSSSSEASSSTSSSESSTSSAPAPSSVPIAAPASPAVTATPAPAAAPAPANNSYTSGGWTVAGSGMVFTKSTSGLYYSRVTNPGNYGYMSQSEAETSGYTHAPKGNEYAQP